MESLVASYASSDEEEEDRHRQHSSSSSSSPLSVIPKPKESRSSPFISSPPPPKTSISRQQNHNPSSSSLPKRVVQIRLPLNPTPTKLDDEDEEEEEEEKARKKKKKRKQMESAASHDSSVRSFLSSIPAPKSSQTLGALPSSGSARRSNLEAETLGITQESESGSDQNHTYDESLNNHHSNEIAAGVDNYYSGCSGGDVYVYNVSSSYGGDVWNGGGGNGGFEATTGLPEAFIAMDSGARRGRRGRDQMPTEIVEVKQDELMKNRPRANHVKSTGIAFGPAYQPESSSSKGKVSKLHKRKHQITALFMDMKHKETELAERRSRGFLTKAETQAKYGW
ncbi:unnamed protein product [Cochlearia groenlandica]